MQTHADILGVGVQPSSVRRGLVLGSSLLLAAAALAQPPACRREAPTRLVERFVPADCERCWSEAAPFTRAAGALVLDWITPAGDDAPMASAALSEAAGRAGRVPAGRTAVHETRLHPSEAPRLRIVDGPAWNGYIGLRLLVTRHGSMPPDAVAYAALVEQVPAGSDGSGVERQLVRALAGPMGLAELKSEGQVEHLRAVTVPRGSRVERLSAVAWIQAPDGRVLAAASSPPAECR
jgi:hypothetical protein